MSYFKKKPFQIEFIFAFSVAKQNAFPAKLPISHYIKDFEDLNLRANIKIKMIE